MSSSASCSSKVDVGVVGLHRDHAYRAVDAQQRSAQPHERWLAHHLGVDFPGFEQRLHAGDVDQLRLAGAQYIFGQAAPERSRTPVALVLVLGVRERHGSAVLGGQCDVEIVRVDEFADDGVHVTIEALARVFAVGQRGDLVQRRLQALAALAFGDFAAELDVGFGQLQGAFGDPAFQFRLRSLAFQCGEDVFGHECEQAHLRGGVLRAFQVALHDQCPEHAPFAHHRHAEPVAAVGAVHAQRAGHLLAQLRGRSHQRLAIADQIPGQAALDLRQRDFLVGIEVLGVDHIGEIQESQAVALAVVQRDVEVFRVHQVGDDAVQAAQHVRHVEVGASHVGDRIERALQHFRLLQARHALLHALDRQHFAETVRGRFEQVGTAVRAVQHRRHVVTVVLEDAQVRRHVAAVARFEDRIDRRRHHGGIAGLRGMADDVAWPMGRPQHAGTPRAGIGLQQHLGHFGRRGSVQQADGQVALGGGGDTGRRQPVELRHGHPIPAWCPIQPSSKRRRAVANGRAAGFMAISARRMPASVRAACQAYRDGMRP